MTAPLKHLLSALEMFRATAGRDHPIQLLTIFLYIATHEGCRQSDVVKNSGMSEGSVSRILDWLGKEHRSGKPGLGLIRREQDPADYKRWLLYMTPKGQALADLMTDPITGGSDD